MKCTAKGPKVGFYETECIGEMIEVGKIDNQGLGLGTQTLYQCESCKTIKLC